MTLLVLHNWVHQVSLNLVILKLATLEDKVNTMILIRSIDFNLSSEPGHLVCCGLRAPLVRGVRLICTDEDLICSIYLNNSLG